MPIGFQLRKYRRFAVQCPLYYSNQETQGSGMVWNMSLNGWRADGTCALTIGMVLSLFVILPRLNKTVIVEKAVVRWSRGQEFGLQTGIIHPIDSGRLRTFISNLVQLNDRASLAYHDKKQIHWNFDRGRI